MSTFALKLIAMIFMVIDHTALALQCSGVLTSNFLYGLLRAIGRPAFPLFCYLLAVGYEKTSSREKYLSRLCLFAAVSQLPFCLVAVERNYSPGLPFSFALHPELLLLIIPIAVYYIYVCGKKLKPSLFPVAAALLLSGVDFSAGGYILLSHENLNVFYTLAISLVCMRVLDTLFSDADSKKKLAYSAAAAVLVYAVQLHADYSLDGLILALMLHYFRSSRKKSALFCAAWCLGMYLLGSLLEGQMNISFAMMSALSLIAPLGIALYNEKRGPKMKTAFYLVYPLHLAVLALFFVILK